MLAQQVRQAELCWVDECPGLDWVTQRLVEIVAAANRSHFDFDLSDFAESAQIAWYPAQTGGHFAWHSDIGAGPVAQRRKLTVVVQLSEAADYEGGALEIWPDGKTVQADRTLGAAIVFPAFTLHRVTPVTRGERASLTIWAHGATFR